MNKKCFNLNNLIDWSDQILSTFDTDTIINYGGLLLIIWGLLSIILMYSGSYAIDRLQLRGRYRILDRFIDYRLKIRKIRKIKMLVKQMKMLVKVISTKFHYAFYLPFILSKLEIDSSKLDSNISEFSYFVLIISVILLYCFLNVLGYMLSLIILQKGNYELKYPRVKFIINYYKKVSKTFLIIDIICCILCLLLLITGSLVFLNLNK